MMRFVPMLVLLVCLAAARSGFAELTPAQVSRLPPAAARPVSFTRDIQPILTGSCLQCHGHARDEGGFQLDTRELLLKGGESGPAVVVSNGAASLLIELVSGLNPDDVMPRKGSRLTPEQVGLLRAWIDQGVPWDAAINFAKPPPRNLKPRRPELPTGGPSTHPVDALLAPYFAAHNFTPPPPVSDRVFARRAYLDVIGLLPGPDDLQDFLGDPRADKRAQLVRRLLADRERYAQHWLSFWNDLLRNDYRGPGYIDGGRLQISRWLYDALVTNLPYNRFVAELINPTPASAGFTKGIVWRGEINSSQTPEMQAAQNVAQVFMGVNLKCASCHDSFINDWRLADAYGLARIYSDKPLEVFRCDKPTGREAVAKFIYDDLGELDPNADKPARLQQLAALMTDEKNGRLSRTVVNRLWQRLFGRGLVEPLDDMEQPAWNVDVLDWLAEDFVAHGYNVQHTLERLLTAQAYQLPAASLPERPEKDFVFRGPGVRRLSAEQFRDAIGQLTDVWYRKADLAVATNHIRASLVAADPLAVALDRPNREQVVTSRPTAATTLQALELTMGGTLAGVLTRGADRLTAGQPAPGALVERLYVQAVGRPPSDIERAAALGFVGQPVTKEGVEDFLWAVAMLPEFQLIY
jgi:mono/diheme cytochrome c family protein